MGKGKQGNEEEEQDNKVQRKNIGHEQNWDNRWIKNTQRKQRNTSVSHVLEKPNKNRNKEAPKISV